MRRRIDNDGDNHIDMADLGCSSSLDNDETNPAPPPPVDAPPVKPVLTICAKTSKTVTLCWAKGESDLAGHRFYLDGVKLTVTGSALTTSFTFTTPGRRSYRLGVEPYDKAGQATLAELVTPRK